MTTAESSLSPLDLITLARLSSNKEPSKKRKLKPKPVTPEDELRAALTELVMPETASSVNELARSVVRSLRDRSLLPPDGWHLTERGRKALCARFRVERIPPWTTLKSTYLSACAIGLPANVAPSSLTTAEAIIAAALGDHGHAGKEYVNAKADALIAEQLGLGKHYGSLTMHALRLHVVSRALRVSSGPTDVETAKRLPLTKSSKNEVADTLIRRWVQSELRTKSNSATSTPATNATSVTPTPPASSSPAPSASSRPKGSSPTVNHDTVLHAVRETLPHIGREGRHGDEKVFVSAIWHRIENDRRVGGLSLDRFKNWLIDANRIGWLVLARADLVGAMDPRLVAESRIDDQGATFHFVLDRQAHS